MPRNISCTIYRAQCADDPRRPRGAEERGECRRRPEGHEELRRRDRLATIPASPEYPILTLSHAVTILLYELLAAKAVKRAKREASGMEKEKLHEAFESLLAATDYPPHKRARTQVMFRRLIGRAVPSKWEFHALMGVIQRAAKRIQRLERKD